MNIYSKFSILDKKEVKDIINIFDKAGAELRFVGGCVRNAFLQIETKDIENLSRSYILDTFGVDI